MPDQRGAAHPIDVGGRHFTWSEFGNGRFQIESPDGRFWFNDSGKHVLVHGDDFPESSGSKPLKIELHLEDLSFTSPADIVEAIIRHCLNGDYAVLGRGKRRT